MIKTTCSKISLSHITQVHSHSGALFNFISKLINHIIGITD